MNRITNVSVFAMDEVFLNYSARNTSSSGEHHSTLHDGFSRGVGVPSSQLGPPDDSTSLRASPAAYVIFAVSVTLISVVGLVVNLMAMYVYAREKTLRKKSHHVFVTGLCISDTMLCLSGMWMSIVSSYARQWLFGRSGCEYYGFTTTALGLTQIALLASIAVDRYLIVIKPQCLRPLQPKHALYASIFCFIFGFIWALLPAVGWSSYELEGIQLRCAINWRSKAASDLSYLLCLMVCAWVVPLGIILFCYIEICRRIRQTERTKLRKSTRQRQNASNRRVRSRDKTVSMTALMVIGAFFLSWTPYSVVTLIILLGNPQDIPAHTAMVPALFTKMSIIWNPLIYVAKHGEFQTAFLKHFSFLNMRQAKVTFRETSSSSNHRVFVRRLDEERDNVDVTSRYCTKFTQTQF